MYALREKKQPNQKKTKRQEVPKENKYLSKPQ